MLIRKKYSTAKVGLQEIFVYLYVKDGAEISYGGGIFPMLRDTSLTGP
jgi:hypothetical protein